MKSYDTIFGEELSKFQDSQDSAIRWKQLERLHILSQLYMSKHYKIHFLMLLEAMKEMRLGEIIGQITRIVLILPGHIFGKLPIGNIGTSRVSVFQSMEIPPEFIHLFNPA